MILLCLIIQNQFLLHIKNMNWQKRTFVVHARLHAGQADLAMPDGPVAFSFLQNVQTGSGVHPGSYLMGSWNHFRQQSVRGR
jgi:hypothetical protein